MLLKQVHEGASVEEMCNATGLRSTSTIQFRLARLEEEGWITPTKKTWRGSPAARSRRLTDKGWDYLNERALLSDRRNPGRPSAA